MTERKRATTTTAAPAAAAAADKPDVPAAAAAADKPAAPAAGVSSPAATGPAPSIGRIVHYRLSRADAQSINRRRKRFENAPDQQWGFQAHAGNHAAAGQVFPAVIVRIFGDADPKPGDSVNLQVLLDGADTYWATSRACGDEDGQWSWPARV